jgi:zinc transport system ATP-binding protein
LQLSHPTVQARSIVVTLTGRPVLHDVDLAVERGGVVALLGANGSGKSTLVRAVLGLVPVASGSVELFGVERRRFQDWSRIGYVPQRVSASSGVPATVTEVVASGRLTGGSWWRPSTRADRAAVRRAIATVGLTDRARDSVARLSGGQQQRTLIARALSREPELLLLDEPIAGVDRASQETLADALRTLAAQGTTVLVVLHELGLLAPLIDRVVVLREGRVTYDGAPPKGALFDPHDTSHDHDHVHPHGPDAEHGERLLP